MDLALVALLAERAHLDGLPGAAPIPSPPEVLVPRIGEYLIEQDLLSTEELNQALDRQRELREADEHKLLGEILVEMNMVEREVLDGIINRQVISLHSALQEANRNLERRVAERTKELEQALRRLTELNQIKANLISNVSHELRTPMAHIKGYVELLIGLQLGPLEEKQVSALEVVQRSTDRLERLLEDLIEFSTSSREGIRLRIREFRIEELFEKVLQRSSAKAEKAEIDLSIEIEHPLPFARGDPERLGWVLNQLVDNGIKFAPKDRSVLLKARRDGDHISLAIQDTGIGIPADRYEEIFLPFHQLDSSSKRAYPGTGLGLALVKLILDAHGVEISVVSEEGKGSTFSFSLPVHQGFA